VIGQHGTTHTYHRNTMPSATTGGPSFKWPTGQPGRTAGQSIGAIIGFTSENGPLFPRPVLWASLAAFFSWISHDAPRVVGPTNDRMARTGERNKASQETLDMLRVGRLVSMDTDGKLFSRRLETLSLEFSSHADSVHVGSIYNSNVLHWRTP